MASLLAALYVLTSAATAYAEPAWVLWEEVLVLNKDSDAREWAIIGAGKTPQECGSFVKGAVTNRVQALRQLAESRGEESQVKAESARVRFVSPSTRIAFDYSYRCLPDTLEPRGPKGK
jgi:hypothetical protein